MFTPAGHRYRATASYNRSENGSALARASSAPRALRWRGIVEGARISVIDPACLDAISSGSGHGGPSQRESAQHVVGEREPQQHGAGLVFAAHEQSGEAHAARPGVGALGLRALLIERFPWLAGHAPALVRHPRFVVRPRCVRIGAMLALRRRAPQFDAALMGPFDVFVLGKPPIDQVI